MEFQYTLLIISYLIGAIPFSIIIGLLFKGIDVRKHGSKNPGSTNAFRYLGTKLGLTILIFDILKGGIVILLIQLGIFENYELLHPLYYGAVASIGHVFSVFLKFKGGKAVATGGGMLLFYNPYVFLIGFISFLLYLKKWKYVSLASSFGAITVTISSLFFNDYTLFYLSLFVTLVILYKHKSNYIKIKNGEENKVTWI